MQAELEQLLVLQNRQQKIRQIQTEIKTVPQQRQHLEAQLAASAASLSALKQKVQHLEMDRKKLELDAGTRRESINRLKTQQYETRKNDEFRAMGNEIERYEKEIHNIEDQELELMDETEKLKVEVAAEEKKAGAARESIARQMADLEEKGKTLESRLSQLTAERAELAARVEEDLLDQFERLFTSKGDAAVVALEHEVCTGCHMKVTTQTAHRVKNGKEIVSCEQCGRILYAADL
ncbi:MAG TPA: C4-type zinc ribbon domain-containing protein [Chthoniobacterales bacterium]|nr:C4-type zinc ribbon domain-containing protein [Chthoniobacterales bacterium]